MSLCSTPKCPKSFARIPQGRVSGKLSRTFRRCLDTFCQKCVFLLTSRLSEALDSCAGTWAVQVTTRGEDVASGSGHQPHSWRANEDPVLGLLWYSLNHQSPAVSPCLGEFTLPVPAPGMLVVARKKPQPTRPQEDPQGRFAKGPLTSQWLPRAPGKPSSVKASSWIQEAVRSYVPWGFYESGSKMNLRTPSVRATGSHGIIWPSSKGDQKDSLKVSCLPVLKDMTGSHPSK